jgi:Rrf2 family nitric oxide-sensitive transcriptional repressor
LPKTWGNEIKELVRLTLYTDYSLRVLIYLAVEQEGLRSTEDISRAYKISKNHLTKIVNNLGAKGYIEVRRGRSGGVRLLKPSADITVGQVVRDCEPDMFLAECFHSKTNLCVITPACELKNLLARAQHSFLETLDRCTLADLTRDPEPRRALARIFSQAR